jgi:hypothetical protein
MSHNQLELQDSGIGNEQWHGYHDLNRQLTAAIAAMLAITVKLLLAKQKRSQKPVIHAA